MNITQWDIFSFQIVTSMIFGILAALFASYAIIVSSIGKNNNRFYVTNDS